MDDVMPFFDENNKPLPRDEQIRMYKRLGIFRAQAEFILAIEMGLINGDVVIPAKKRKKRGTD